MVPAGVAGPLSQHCEPISNSLMFMRQLGVSLTMLAYVNEEADLHFRGEFSDSVSIVCIEGHRLKSISMIPYCTKLADACAT